MKIFVDADACPVKDIVYQEACSREIPVTMVVSMAHDITAQEGMDVIRVDSSYQAVDIAIVNKAVSGDIVVTSDFGLASIVLGKGARCISPSGMVYSERNIDTLLAKRHITARHRKGGGRTKGPRARKRGDDDLFRKNLIRLIENSEFSSQTPE